MEHLKDGGEALLGNGKVTSVDLATEEIHLNQGPEIGNACSVENRILQRGMNALDVDVQRESVGQNKEDIIAN